MCSFAILNILLKEREFLLLDFRHNAFIHLRGILNIKLLIFVGYIVSKNIHQNLIKGKNLVMNGFIKKNKMPVYKIYCFSNWSNPRFFCNSRLGARMEGRRTFSSLTCNELSDVGNWHGRSNDHHWSIKIKSVQEEYQSEGCLTPTHVSYYLIKASQKTLKVIWEL